MSLKKSGLLIDGVTETVKLQIKQQEGKFLGAMIAPWAASLIAHMASSLTQPVGSSLINAISGKRAWEQEKGQEGKILPLLALPLMIKVLPGKGVTKYVMK